MRNCSISSALAMEILQSCTKPSTYIDKYQLEWGISFLSGQHYDCINLIVAEHDMAPGSQFRKWPQDGISHFRGQCDASAILRDRKTWNMKPAATRLLDLEIWCLIRDGITVLAWLGESPVRLGTKHHILWRCVGIVSWTLLFSRLYQCLYTRLR